MLGHWMYVSTNRIPSNADSEVEKLVRRSIEVNGEKNVTGALLFTGEHFVQYIEGPPDGVDSLRIAIQRDPRHSDIITLREGPCPHRLFVNWSLAYAGPATYVSSLVADMDIATSTERVDRVITVMTEFVFRGHG